MDRARWRRLLPWLAVGVAYALVRWRFMDVPLDRDEGVFGWIGQSILRGEVPYVDVFDHKPPGVFYVYALALLAFPATAVGVHLFLAVWNAGTLALVASSARALGGRAAGLWAAWTFVFLSAASPVQGFAATTEMLLLLPLAASLRLLLAARGDDVPARRRAGLLLAAGACAAAACWTKQSAGIALAGALFALFAARPWGAALRDVATFVAGGLALSVLVALPFVAIGAFDAFWYWSFTHSLIYGAWSWEQVPPDVWRAGVLEHVRALLPIVGVPLGAGVAAYAVGWARRSARHGWIAVFVLTSVIGSLHSAFLYTHYFAQLVPAVALAGGLGLAAAGRWFAGTDATARRGAVVALSLAAAVAGLPVLADRRYWLTDTPAQLLREHAGPQGFEAAPVIANHIAERAPPDAWVYVHGSEPQIAFLAQRRLANPFGMAYPFTGPYPRAREFQERVWTSIRATRPLFVVTTRNTVSLLNGPDTDPYLDRQVDDLLRTSYAIDAQLVFRDERWMLVRDRPAAELHALRREAFFSIWVRR